MVVPCFSLHALESPAEAGHKAQELLRRPVHGPQRPGIDSTRGFFLLSPLPQKVESSAEVGSFAVRREAGCLTAEDVPLRKEGRQVSAESRAPEFGSPLRQQHRAGDGAAAGPSTGRPELPSPQGQGRLNP